MNAGPVNIQAFGIIIVPGINENERDMRKS